MGALTAISAFFKAKDWLLPLILGGVVGLTLIVGGIWLYEKGKTNCQAQAAMAVLKAQQKADALAAKLEETEAKQREVTNQKEVVYVDRVRQAPSDIERLRAAIGGMRDLLRPGNSKAQPGSDSSVPRPNAVGGLQ